MNKRLRNSAVEQRLTVLVVSGALVAYLAGVRTRSTIKDSATLASPSGPKTSARVLNCKVSASHAGAALHPASAASAAAVATSSFPSLVT